ncbi:EAL domain-containing response regulator [Enterovibrio sp. ZSDZ42]|uniref:EAL domain-containing response regulator n=1 Tax=Enterovibrio gelatinilyticus TaxID=2899819 RepID=A0ABT5R276_9GAMM|nr:EAL domain-containing response regulator [Enterovibrio sp. ZSDZ42]MDD1794372.1 EAL domain-containing response regulator [Enterovibrio sp. ZSDZ42]
MKILLVEDHPFQRDMMSGQLMQLLSGTDELLTAKSGSDALEQTLIEKPDLVFCDLQLTDIDGIELLTNMAERGFMGCIVITSAASPKVLETVQNMCENLHLNVLGVLPKPASIPLLKHYIEVANNHDVQFPQDLVPLREDEVLEAWKSGQFETWFQPIVRLEDGEWIACEALQRLRHPTRHIILPRQFLPQLSTLGLESELTMTVIEAVIEHQETLQGRPVGINISMNNLIELKFVDNIISMAEDHPKLCEHIYFELMEPEHFSHISQVQEAASRLLLNGFRIAIDDFGTGHSSLQEVEFLPIDSLKVGLSLVLPMLSSRTSSALVEASILIARRIGIASVAEGIECIETWHGLRDMGCDYGQGFFIAKAMPAHDLSNWYPLWMQLKNHRSLCPSHVISTI